MSTKQYSSEIRWFLFDGAKYVKSVVQNIRRQRRDTESERELGGGVARA